MIVNITKHSDKLNTISCKDSLFKDEVIRRIHDNKCIFELAGLDHSGKTHKFHKNSSGSYVTSISKEIPVGVYEIDEEESNEDKIVFYFR